MYKGSWIKSSIHNVETEKYTSKASTVKLLKDLFGRNTDSAHNMESTLWYFPQYGKYNLSFPYCGNYNLDFPPHGKNGLNFFSKNGSKIIYVPHCASLV